MQLEYYTVDVFAETQFGGNQLAVVHLTSRDQLTTEQMQTIAREFNYSETTFIIPPTNDKLYSANLRIFTIGMELPFAGHPNVGSAYVLSKNKLAPLINGKVVFEELAGTVVCDIDDETVTITAPEKYNEIAVLGKNGSGIVADCLEISPEKISGKVVSGGCGLPFLLAEVDSLETLNSCEANPSKFKLHEKVFSETQALGIHVFFVDNESTSNFDVHARMFFPDLGMILEDPATGSANCALVGHLGSANRVFSPGCIKRISQGVKMGRPSCLSGTYASDGSVKIGGKVFPVMQGRLNLSLD